MLVLIIKQTPIGLRKTLKALVFKEAWTLKFYYLKKKKFIKEAEKYLKIFKDYPYVFNLGHGILPATNPDKVDKLVKFVKEYK